MIALAPWREAVTYRDTWPHEYVVVAKDGQQELLAAFHHRISQGEGIECRFFHSVQEYLFLGQHRYWALQDGDEIILNRALLYKDRRDFVIREGDTGDRGERMSEIEREDTENMPDIGNDDETVNDEQASELGRIQYVENIRAVWPNEAEDFTPWLAENLDALGWELGLELELVEMEKAVGSFFLDILARDGDGGLVAIENQLELTDHGHLGQLLTYAAGCEANIMVWVSPWFRAEHREAINRINRLASSGMKFYGVEVRCIKIGDSLTAPDFRVIAAPSDWGWV